jgi:hypothetical protein
MNMIDINSAFGNCPYVHQLSLQLRQYMYLTHKHYKNITAKDT